MPGAGLMSFLSTRTEGVPMILHILHMLAILASRRRLADDASAGVDQPAPAPADTFEGVRDAVRTAWGQP